MACETYRDIIDKYVEGLATLDEKTALEEHIKTCADCKSEVEDISKILRAFNSFESVDLPDDFMPSLHDKLLKMQAKHRNTGATIFFPKFIRISMASFYNFYRHNSKALAAGLCVILISFFLGRFSGMPGVHLTRTGNNIEQQMAKTESMSASSKAAQSPAALEQKSSEQNPVENNRIQADISGGSEKKLMMADNSAQSETEIEEEAQQEIQKNTLKDIQKDVAARAENDGTVHSIALNKSSRDGSVKDMASLKSGIQYKALQESGPKAAAATPSSQKEIQSKQVTVLVNDFDKKVVSAISLADQLGGDIQQSKITIESGGNSRKAYIVMKVPVENMASALEQIEALGELEKNFEEPQNENKGEAKTIEVDKRLMTVQTQDQKEQSEKNFSDKETVDEETQDKEKELAIIQINIIEKETVQEPTN